MRVIDQFGNQHEVTSDNSLVTIFRKRVWKYLDHIFHLCHESMCPAQMGINIYLFERDLINLARKQRFDELWKWEPDEVEHRTWENYRNGRKIRTKEVEEFAEQISKADDEDIWEELNGFDES